MTRTKASQTPSLDKLSVTALKGVGKQLAEKLTKLQIYHVQDLLFHLPHRYMDRTRISPIGSLRPYANVVVEGEIRVTDVVYGRRRSLVCKIQDGTGTLTLRFFHFSGAQKQSLSPGNRLRCYGEVRPGSSGLEIYHPEYQVASDKPFETLEQKLTPVYPLADGITQARLRSLVEQSLALMSRESVRDLLPPEHCPTHFNVDLIEALNFLHRPPQDAPIDALLNGEHPYQQRLALEELVAHQLSMLQARARVQAEGAPPLPRNDKLSGQFEAGLPFALTDAQRRVIHEISDDLTHPYPMLRLVQGDVGSGKTIVAAMAALQAVANGFQVAVMAPTEILADQHLQSFRGWFEPLGVSVGWLSGRQKASERKTELQSLLDGSTQVVVGTHALFQDDVAFACLGLSIIDEQHRFGVHQRLALRQKGDSEHSGRSHQLIMTATPIPRTLAMSAYADLDCSVIDELPKGRQPVTTAMISGERRPQVIERISSACGQGRQAYWVCTLIEESESLEAEAAQDTAEMLQGCLPHLNIGLVHGRMKPAEKDQVMSAFKSGELHLLVATTVIEVGVDVPNASLMVIENPERLGLAQLHQLRGRVGRGREASHCVLLYSSPLSNTASQRLAIMRETSDGFKIAEHDLKIRGPGEVLGTRQTGDVRFKIADLQRDGDLLVYAKPIAKSLQADQSECLIDRWLGKAKDYAGA